jgi:hypothetical protein
MECSAAPCTRWCESGCHLAPSCVLAEGRAEFSFPCRAHYRPATSTPINGSRRLRLCKMRHRLSRAPVRFRIDEGRPGLHTAGWRGLFLAKLLSRAGGQDAHLDLYDYCKFTACCRGGRPCAEVRHCAKLQARHCRYRRALRRSVDKKLHQ